MDINIASLEKCLFKSFAHFPIFESGFFFFVVVVEFYFSLYISDINPLPDIIILILMAVSNLFCKIHFTIYFSMIFLLFPETHIHMLI